MERRVHPRVPLDAPFFVTVCPENKQECLAMLVDCGRSGAQLAFSPVEGVMEHSSLLSQQLTLLNLPKGLKTDSKGCSGTVVWISPQRCGVQFHQVLDLTDEELMEITSCL